MTPQNLKQISVIVHGTTTRTVEAAAVEVQEIDHVTEIVKAEIGIVIGPHVPHRGIEAIGVVIEVVLQVGIEVDVTNIDRPQGDQQVGNMIIIRRLHLIFGTLLIGICHPICMSQRRSQIRQPKSI